MTLAVHVGALGDGMTASPTVLAAALDARADRGRASSMLATCAPRRARTDAVTP